MQESPTKPYEHLRVVWGGRSRKTRLTNARRNRRSIQETDQHGPYESNDPNEDERSNRSIDPNHSTLATEFNADDGQFRSSCLTIENGSSSIQIENFRRYIERKTSIDRSAKFDIGKIRWTRLRSKSTVFLRHFIERKKTWNPNPKDRSSRWPRQSGTKLTITNESIETKSMNPTQKCDR